MLAFETPLLHSVTAFYDVVLLYITRGRISPKCLLNNGCLINDRNKPVTSLLI